MTFEQPAVFNKFVVDPMALTWRGRWKFVRIFLPLIAFITICFVETIVIKLWTRGEFEFSRLGPVLLMPAFLLTFIFIANEIRSRASQRANRLLNVLEKGISFRAGGRPVIRWLKVVAFWFENIPGEPRLSKATVEYFGDRKTKFPLRYSLVLEKQSQCPVLLSELKLLQQQNNLNFRIELDRTLPVRKSPRNLVLGLSLSLAGMLFLMPGIPLLLVPLMHRGGKSDHSESMKIGLQKQKDNFAIFLKAHFSSKAELDKFILGSGGVLTAIGVALMVSGIMIQRQNPEKTLHDYDEGKHGTHTKI